MAKYSFMRHWWESVRANIPYYDYASQYCYNGTDHKGWLDETSTPCSGLGQCEDYCDEEDYEECELRLENIRHIQDGTM